MPRTLSLFALIAANLVPLVGVLFFAWDASLVLALFWIENLIIGAFNLTKMLALAIYSKRFKDLPLCGFFVLHFGLFCSAHGLLLWDLLGFDEIDVAHFFSYSDSGFLSIFLEGAAVFLSFVEMHGATLLLGIAALFLSHLVSFIENFILRGEIFTSSPSALMGKPYPQIIVMHAGLIIGAFAIEKFGSTIWLLLVMVLFKLIVDIKLHLKRRQTPDQNLIKAD